MHTWWGNESIVEVYALASLCLRKNLGIGVLLDDSRRHPQEWKLIDAADPRHSCSIRHGFLEYVVPIVSVGIPLARIVDFENQVGRWSRGSGAESRPNITDHAGMTSQADSDVTGPLLFRSA